MKQVSVGMIKELQIILELSQNGTKKLCSTLRKGLGQQAVESNMTEKLSEIEKTLESFYNVEKMALKDSENNCIFRDVLYVKSTSDFVNEIIKQRDLDPTTAFVRVSLDGGGGFLKVIVNVFETEEFEESESNFKNSGVQRSQILSLVQDAPENSHNLHIILEKLKLDETKYHLAFDMKCANILFGLSGHGGKFACLWCEGDCADSNGKLRSLGSIDEWHQKYVEDGEKHSKMKLYKNVINRRLVYLDSEPETLLQNLVPPPELHLLIGVVDKLGNVILKLWPEFDNWLTDNYIMKRGYQGSGWNGNNANKILKNVDSLEFEIQTKAPHLLPFIKCLRDFKLVKSSCFGNNLEVDYERNVNSFRDSFLFCCEVAASLETQLRVSWKVHAVMNHVVPFCKEHNCGLSRFAEQTGEAIHSKFAPTWARLGYISILLRYLFFLYRERQIQEYISEV